MASGNVTGGSLRLNSWTPLALPNLVGFWDPGDTTTITSSSGLTSRLANKNRSGLDFTAAGSARPTTGTRTMYGRNALAFDGVANTMVTDAIAGSVQPYTLLISFAVDGGSFYDIAGAVTSTEGVPRVNFSSFLCYIIETDSGGQPGGSFFDLNPHVLSFEVNSTSSRLFSDGDLTISGDPSGGSTSSFATGLRLSLLTNGSPLSGLIGGVILTSSILSTANRQLAEAYLARP